jgi:hypothetical protein
MQNNNYVKDDENQNIKRTKAYESTKPNPTTHTLVFHLNTKRTFMLELFNESNSKINHKEYQFEIKSFIVPIPRTNHNGYPLSNQ